MEKVSEASLETLIVELLEARESARLNKDWSRADPIRDGFKRAGIKIVDEDEGPKWSIEKDVIDSLEYFHSVRAAFASNDPTRIVQELNRASEAGVEFSDHAHLDVSPAWRGVPTDAHVRMELEAVQERLKTLK